MVSCQREQVELQFVLFYQVDDLVLAVGLYERISFGVGEDDFITRKGRFEQHVESPETVSVDGELHENVAAVHGQGIAFEVFRELVVDEILRAQPDIQRPLVPEVGESLSELLFAAVVVGSVNDVGRHVETFYPHALHSLQQSKAVFPVGTPVVHAGKQMAVDVVKVVEQVGEIYVLCMETEHFCFK